MTEVIEVKNLTVTYNNKKVVNEVSFSVLEGEIFTMIGPNGAGKTTTIECIEGLRNNYDGSIKVLNLNPKKNRKKLYELIGVQLQETSFQDKIKVWEVCKLFASFYTQPLDYEKLLDDFSIGDKKNDFVSNLSGGQQQKLSIVLSLLSDPQIIFFDELTTGLDPQARRSMWEYIKKLKNQGKTVFMTTHYMDEAEYLSDRVAIINKGKIIGLDTVNNLIRKSQLEDKIIFSASNISLSEIRKIPGVNLVDKKDEEVTIYGIGNDLLGNIINFLQSKGYVYYNLKVIKPNLEDVFFKITGCDFRDLEGCI